MGDSSGRFGPSDGLQAKDLVGGKKAKLGSSSLKVISNNAVNSIASFNHNKGMGGAIGSAALFLLKVAALESIRRFSKAKCPVAWQGLQALQVLCYPPFKWIQKWRPFKGLVKGVEVLSRPLLIISVATSFSSQTECSNATDVSDSPSRSEGHSEEISIQTTLDTRFPNETPHGTPSENWLISLYEELENQGIVLPERFTEDEFRRFYRAADGDFACLLSSIKKTIRWRDNYHMLSDFELEEWSHMVFWHGFDVKRRPCLIVRLGPACITLPAHDRPRFAQAVISQVEHGVLHLVDEEKPQIAVLVDCEGLSTFKFPMQMMRSCSSLLQDHFPNRLGSLVVIRLPPVVRVLAQTFIQVLKPVTREKLKIEGDEFLFEYLQSLPSYLDGKCSCTNCAKLKARVLHHRVMPVNEMGLLGDGSEGEDLIFPHRNNDMDSNLNRSCEQLLRTAIISILMLWVFVAVIAGLYDPETGNFSSS